MKLHVKSLFQNRLNLTQVTALAAILASPVWAATTSSPFTRYDINADGKISLEEFQAQGGLVKAFHDGDINRDLQLDKQELGQANTHNDRILSGKYIDDAWITAKVKTKLLQDDLVKGLSVNVETTQGTVQLSGWVDSAAQITQAANLTRTIGGVKNIRNDLLVKR